MNAVVNIPAKKKPGTALTVQERAARALKVTEKREHELRALAESSKDIVAITNADGREQVHAMCMVLRNTRLDISSDADSVREDAKQFNRSVLAFEKQLIGITQPEEDRLRKLRDDWDAECQRIKDEQIAAEQKRVADLQQRVANLRGVVALVASFNCTSAEILEQIAGIERVQIDESFEELQISAVSAKEDTLAQLQGMLAGAVAREIEADRLRKEREAFDLQRQEQARLQAWRDEQERATQARQAAEDKRLAAERADIERQREELRKAREPALQPLPATSENALVESIFAEPAVLPTAEPAAFAIPVAVRKPLTAGEIVSILVSHRQEHPELILGDLQAIDWYMQAVVSEAA